jgi:hypothetical protein
MVAAAGGWVYRRWKKMATEGYALSFYLSQTVVAFQGLVQNAGAAVYCHIATSQ